MTDHQDQTTNRLRGWKRLRSSAWFHLFLSLTVVALFHGFIAKPYAVPSGSMEQTLEVGDRIYVNRLGNFMTDPERGQVVVFNASQEWDTVSTKPAIRTIVGMAGDILGFGPSNHHTLVKRVIGLPGDTVECCSSKGNILINGKSIDEPYLFDDYPFVPGSIDCTTEERSLRCFDAVLVADDRYLLLGDHRSNSSDSVGKCRGTSTSPKLNAPGCARFATRDDVVGEVFFRIWPLSRLGVT